jgi:Mn-dependent DtxR family transcriptional regulator
MIETIKQFHQEHGYYPNRVQLARMLKKDVRTIDKQLERLKQAKIIKKTKPVCIVTANYTLI